MLFLSPLSFLFQIQCSSFLYSLASYVQTLHLKIHCSTVWWKTAQCLVLKSLWMCDHHLCYIISCLHQKYVCNLHALFTADIRPGDQLSPSNQTDRWRGQRDWWTERWRENEQGEKTTLTGSKLFIWLLSILIGSVMVRWRQTHTLLMQEQEVLVDRESLAAVV